MGASSPGKCRSPQTAPRLWRPYLGSIEPSRSPEVMLDAFRASLTGPESCLLQLRPCAHKFQRAQIGRGGVPQRPGCRAGIIYERSALLAAPRSAMGRLCNLCNLLHLINDEMQQVAHIATCLPMTAIAGEPSGMMYELMAGRLACVAQVQQSFWPSMSTYHAGAFLALELKFDASGGNSRPVRAVS